MRIFICIIVFLVTASGFSQSSALARNYFQQGEFEKSLHVYERLRKQQPRRLDYLKGQVENLQELERFQEAEAEIKKLMAITSSYPQLYVFLGYNFALQNNPEAAAENYQKAIDEVAANVQFAYNVGRTFRDYNLLDHAVQVYEMAMAENDKMNFSTQLAQIYGEQGNLEKMFGSYLDILEKNNAFKSSAQRYFSQYITEDPSNEANVIFRRTVLQRSQKTPDIIYNELLSWVFIQQKEFDKAFAQEKAIFRRSDNHNLNGIIGLANIAIGEEDFDIGRETVNYVIENALTNDARLQASQVLMEIEVITAKPKDYPKVEAMFEKLFETYGYGKETYLLQVDYNHFLAFKQNKKDQAISNLRTLMTKVPLTIYEEARVKMELADILVVDEKFNQALIYYSQIQNKVRNDALAQEARFKVARTSYFKGDFEWAQTQLDVLKKSTSQLIANDAMQLSLMIKDNSLEDSLQTALKKYARADLLELQERHQEAIALLEEILVEHQGESIEDEALLKQGLIYEKIENYEQAERNYLKIVQFFGHDILADDALYYLARLYETKLDDPTKAKAYYEQLLFNHQDSIYFVEARRKFRMLRGDEIN